eukprot:CAMPEP_0115000166 /NCGR_PEP_ID=MMETSP0216-20121206/16594_1 /TAXON_ID=223996 /ORGANISM="Protocruzia adherens, Strain Boccale" /LENGTH=408 /DNA_ID=CAMNT_0002365209 /DNA_START=25 /DNA_END=1251 /DNA_ORIENTATION=-
MGERGLQIRSGQYKQAWEESDFPILCETCLGDNPYIRMTKAPADRECKICSRPFTVFRWKPGTNARFKKTEICQTCAKSKNVCQTCLFDLEYGLPVAVRDHFLDQNEVVQVPEDETNRDFWAQQQTNNIDKKELPYFQKVSNPVLEKLARSAPNFKRNRAHICSFYVRGECTRGAECPYRHEMPDHENDMAEQNIKDRFFGKNDPVADKILAGVGEKESSKLPQAPADRSVTTLFVGGVTNKIKEEQIRDTFRGYGQIKNVKVVSKHACAFVTFQTRESAEEAMKHLYNRLVINTVRMKLLWGRSQQERREIQEKKQAEQNAKRTAITSSSASAEGNPTGKHQAITDPKAMASLLQNGLDVLNSSGKSSYPSMDPTALGGIKAHMAKQEMKKQTSEKPTEEAKTESEK